MQRCELLILGTAVGVAEIGICLRARVESWRGGRPHVLWPMAVDASPMAEVFAPMAVAYPHAARVFAPIATENGPLARVEWPMAVL